MKKLLILMVIVLMITASACRKCFECSNACTNCYQADSLVASICADTLSDIQTFEQRISQLELSGINCIVTKTPKLDYCIQKDEESRYRLYYNNYYCSDK